MWRGERSSWRCTNNGGCRGITKVHSGAARRRQRRIINPIHAAFVKGLGDRQYDCLCLSPFALIRQVLLRVLLLTGLSLVLVAQKQWFTDLLSLLVDEPLQLLVRKAGYSRAVAKDAAADLVHSTTTLYSTGRPLTTSSL